LSLVLIADDNPHAHRMGRQILSQEGHEVVTVSNGDEALEYLAHTRPDLIMADTRMPGPNGYELCREVKHSGRFPGVKVVLLAGPLEPFDPASAESAGSDAVLHKPLDATR
jgi:CheY-like chemotaxis protein